MRSVVTGAAGFVGSSIVDQLLAEGHEVVGIDCFVDYYPRALKLKNLTRALDSSRFQFLESNLLEMPLVETLTGADWVFHQAAQAGVRASWGKSFQIYTDNNILATQLLLEAAKSPQVRPSLKKIVYASSSSVYGQAETLPTGENLRPQPISPYGVSKLAAEHLMGLYTHEFGVPTVSLRYFTVYGPRQRPDMAFNKFIQAGLKDEELVVYGNGEQSRDFTFIDDIVRANISAAATTSKELVLNIGGGSRVTVNEVLKKIGDIIGKPLKISYRERQLGDVAHTGADTSLARKSIQYNPQVTLDIGLRKEAEWLSALLKG